MIVYFKKNNNDVVNDIDFFFCFCRSLLLYEYDNDYIVDFFFCCYSKFLFLWLEIVCFKIN